MRTWGCRDHQRVRIGWIGRYTPKVVILEPRVGSMPRLAPIIALDKAVAWMDQHESQDKELHRFRVEAAELLKIKEATPELLPLPKESSPQRHRDTERAAFSQRDGSSRAFHLQ